MVINVQSIFKCLHDGFAEWFREEPFVFRSSNQYFFLQVVKSKILNLRWFIWPNKLLRQCQRESKPHQVEETRFRQKNSNENVVVPIVLYNHRPHHMHHRHMARHCHRTEKIREFRPQCMTALPLMNTGDIHVKLTLENCTFYLLRKNAFRKD